MFKTFTIYKPKKLSIKSDFSFSKDKGALKRFQDLNKAQHLQAINQLHRALISVFLSKTQAAQMSIYRAIVQTTLYIIVLFLYVYQVEEHAGTHQQRTVVH
jgi:hypothetical protein